MDNMKWDEIGGLATVKQELREAVEFSVQHPEKSLEFGLYPVHGVFLYGPPGNGKTVLAKAVASECDVNLIHVSGFELLGMQFDGEVESNVRALFDRTRAAAPCVMVLDNFDAISHAAKRDLLLNHILAEMLRTTTAKAKVFIIGVTNRPERIDPALLRPGRLEHHIYLPLPDNASRLSILKTSLKMSPVSPDVDFGVLASLMQGFSGSDIVEICQRAAKIAIRESIEADVIKARESEERGDAGNVDAVEEEALFITRRHFEEILKFARPSVSDKDIRCYEDFANTWQLK
ncbi:P-loop containing nucleoside triphosphate hydrolase protein [Mycena alexandri]|uniref:P-loop containing nucleoside triphosphate hydrolase protein n=1 Tax=Mycena alexandri TaxID=1745969 RepID=A0AAD6T8B0_9AGAR|nr:P-loop containing nucleoside triphosphate hydrolase protein [Mycena alexandri]